VYLRGARHVLIALQTLQRSGYKTRVTGVGVER
jgi:hypothetical protein